MAFDVTLGPLKFVAPVDAVGESVGDGLDVVGQALMAGERKPRTHKLKLAVRGEDSEAEPKPAGLRLRRQLRQLFNNADWRLLGLFLYWTPDEDMDSWLLIGSALVNETDPGISFGEFAMELNDVYLAGRPGTHGPGRRAAILDRRQGTVPRDTRGLLYSKDFEVVTLPAKPLFLPGNITDEVTSSRNAAPSISGGLQRDANHVLWQRSAAIDGEVFSFVPDVSKGMTTRERFLLLDQLGSVRVWDLSKATLYPPNPAEYTTAKDEDPTQYGWEQMMGPGISALHPLAMDNGACRVIWLGSPSPTSLAIEYWDETTKHFLRIGRVQPGVNGINRQWIVELTPERGVLEWRLKAKAMRVILQRGWWGPRLESYDDTGTEARLEYAPDGSGTASSVAAYSPGGIPMVREVKLSTPGHTMLWASGSEGETVENTVSVAGFGPGVNFHRAAGVMVAQLAGPGGSTAPTAKELGEMSLVDARPTPVLLGR